MESKILIIDNDEKSEASFILNETLKQYQEIILSCIGPYSKLKFCGSKHDSTHLIITNTSKNLYENMYKIDSERLTKNECLKLTKWKFELISSTIYKSHFNLFYDSGLFLTYLINQTILLGIDKKFINKILLNLIEHLNQNDKNHFIKFKINLDNLNHLKNLIITSLQTKQSINLNCTNDTDTFLNLYLKLLIKSVNNDSFSRILYIFNDTEALDLDQSESIDGILIKSENVDFEKVNNLKCVILDSNILSGDFEILDNIGLKFQIEASQLKSQSQQFLSLNFLIENIKILFDKFKINVLFCQKVVHPSIKSYLKKQGNILVFDRLGLSLTEPVRELLNCKILNSIFNLELLDEDYFGYLNNIKLKKINNDYFYHLESEKNLIQTFLVCVPNESFTPEIEYVLKTTEKVFQRTIMSGYGLIGGPCFYSYCIAFLWKHELKTDRQNQVKNFRIIKELFYKFLKKLIDSECEYLMSVNTGHLFKKESEFCECGLVLQNLKQDFLDLDSVDFRLDNLKLFDNQKIFKIDFNNIKLIDCIHSKLNCLKITRDVLSTLLHIGIFVSS
ncbi:unnamed protein product [Brachionus calyciflorus]|uniref:Uncharacterized protein n=1 Tax=Brachionus calyciflorus TaxID=104777 RepID=A0A813VEG6_9BILA|nr:unnamed protein product [Brachionus calyciflorus]